MQYYYLSIFWIFCFSFHSNGLQAIQSGSGTFPAIREHHTHPLESIDFPFVPGSNREGSKLLLVSIESYQDITNETVLYMPLVWKFVREKFGENETNSRISVKYAGWRFSPTKKDVMIRFKHFDSANNSIEMNCAILMDFVKDNAYLLQSSNCIPATEAKCYSLKTNLAQITIDIFNPTRRMESELDIIDCYGTRSCISEYKTIRGIRTIHKLGCFRKEAMNVVKQETLDGSNCLHRSEVLENEIRRTECMKPLCNDPYYSEIADSTAQPIIEHLNQVVHRLDAKFQDLENLIKSMK